MTRINVVPPPELTDKHLIAEYRELPRVSTLARKLSEKEIVDEYCLGKGHVKFFYDKGLFLKKRFKAIVREMKARGWNPKHTTYRPHPRGLNKDWIATAKALRLNRERIRERLIK